MPDQQTPCHKPHWWNNGQVVIKESSTCVETTTIISQEDEGITMSHSEEIQRMKRCQGTIAYICASYMASKLESGGHMNSARQ